MTKPSTVQHDSFVQKAFAGQPIDNCLVIDAHSHLDENPIFPFLDTSLETLVARMNCLGIKTVCVSSLPAIYGKARLGNDRVINAMRRYPGRIFGYMCVDPGYPERIVPEMERCLAAGVRGVKIHSYSTRPLLAYDSPNLAPLYEFTNAHGLPLLVHSFTTEELQQLQPQFTAYPRINFILGHTGACGLDPYMRLAKTHDNVFMETCLSLSPRGLFETIVDEGLGSKVLWGSDEVFMDASQQLGRVLFARVGESDKARILGGNAARVLHLGEYDRL
jgi:predicted TIM-barrel fold metal-dependent hydrolase